MTTMSLNNPPPASPLGESIAQILEEGEKQVERARQEDALVNDAATAYADYKAGKISADEGKRRFGAAFAKFLELGDFPQEG